MAKGGGKRTYTRDSNGRFASTPGSAAKKAAKSTSGRAGTLGARTGLKGSRAKLKAKDKADQTLQTNLSTRAQKSAVTRGSRKLAAAKVAAQARISGGRKGVIGKPKGLKPAALPAAKSTEPRSTRGKKVVTGDRVGRMIGRIAARRDQLVRGSNSADPRLDKSKDVVRRAMAFTQGKAYNKKNTKQQNLELNKQHEKAIAAGKPQDSPLYKNVARAIESSPKRSAGKQRKKSKQETLWQANQIIKKTIRKMAKDVGQGKKNPIRTQNSRQVQVERILERKGLLGEYLRLTAVGDPTYRRRPGPGIKEPPRRRKPKQ